MKNRIMPYGALSCSSLDHTAHVPKLGRTCCSAATSLVVARSIIVRSADEERSLFKIKGHLSTLIKVVLILAIIVFAVLMVDEE